MLLKRFRSLKPLRKGLSNQFDKNSSGNTVIKRKWCDQEFPSQTHVAHAHSTPRHPRPHLHLLLLRVAAKLWGSVSPSGVCMRNALTVFDSNLSGLNAFERRNVQGLLLSNNFRNVSIECIPCLWCRLSAEIHGQKYRRLAQILYWTAPVNFKFLFPFISLSSNFMSGFTSTFSFLAGCLPSETLMSSGTFIRTSY